MANLEQFIEEYEAFFNKVNHVDSDNLFKDKIEMHPMEAVGVFTELFDGSKEVKYNCRLPVEKLESIYKHFLARSKLNVAFFYYCVTNKKKSGLSVEESAKKAMREWSIVGSYSISKSHEQTNENKTAIFLDWDDTCEISNNLRKGLFNFVNTYKKKRGKRKYSTIISSATFDWGSRTTKYDTAKRRFRDLFDAAYSVPLIANAREHMTLEVMNRKYIPLLSEKMDEHLAELTKGFSSYIKSLNKGRRPKVMAKHRDLLNMMGCDIETFDGELNLKNLTLDDVFEGVCKKLGVNTFDLNFVNKTNKPKLIMGKIYTDICKKLDIDNYYSVIVTDNALDRSADYHYPIVTLVTNATDSAKTWEHCISHLESFCDGNILNGARQMKKKPCKIHGEDVLEYKVSGRIKLYSHPSFRHIYFINHIPKQKDIAPFL